MDDALFAATKTGSPFAILSVTPDSSETDIIIACNRTSRRCGGEKHAVALVEMARDILLDPGKRKSWFESQERKARAAAEKVAAGPFEGDALIRFDEMTGERVACKEREFLAQRERGCGAFAIGPSDESMPPVSRTLKAGISLAKVRHCAMEIFWRRLAELRSVCPANSQQRHGQQNQTSCRFVYSICDDGFWDLVDLVSTRS